MSQLNYLTKKLSYFLAISLCFLCGSLTAQNSVTGTWSPIYNADMIPVACANLPDGKILSWSAYDRYNFGGDNGQTYTSIFDPANNSFTTTLMANTGHDMFCPGTANIGNGEVVITGGSSSSKTTIYNPTTNTFRAGQTMNTPRGYHSMATLNDGRVFTVGGSWSGGEFNKKAEVWSEATGWLSLDNVDSDRTVRQGAPDPRGIYRDDNHAWLLAAPNGRVFQAGPGTNMHWINTSGEGSVEDAGLRGDDPYAMNGTAVMYDVGRILKAGGAETYGQETPASNRAYVIDIRGGNANVNQTDNLNKARTLHHSVVLPNGEVMVLGGACKSVLFSDECAHLTAEIWNPNTGAWTETVAMQVPRTYHSVGILMQDGRVWVAGGGLCGGCNVNHPDAEIYTPPYLYDGNALATRPVINTAPTSATYNSNITVTTNTSVQDFVLMRLSSSTHSVNTEQRRIPVTFNNNGGNNYTVNIPNRDWLPPGDYFLFALKDGVPSIAKTIKVGSNSAAQQIVNDGTYYIESLPTGQHLASPDFDGNNVRMIDQGTGDDQKWEITHINNNVYTLKNLRTNRYLNVFNGDCANGTNLITWANSADANSRWIISKVGNEYQFRPVHCTTQAMDNGNGPNQSTLTWGFSTGNNNQRFKLKPASDGGDNGNGLAATYYNNIDFTGSTITRVDPTIDFSWGQGSPASAIDVNTYSARWEGAVEAPTSGTYTFFTTTDDGVRLWVNNQLIIDRWVNQAPTEVQANIQMTAGQKVSIKMEYYENAGGAVAQLRWQGPNVEKQIIPSKYLFPDEIVDNGNNTRLTINGTYLIQSKADGQNAISPSWDNFNVRKFSAGTVYPDHQWVFEHIGEGKHTIRNVETNRYLETFAGQCANGANVNTYVAANADHHRWYIELINGDYFLIPSHCTSHAMDKNTDSDVNIHIWNYDTSNNNQQWDLIPQNGSVIPRDDLIEKDLRATPILGQKTQLNWYVTQVENKKVTQYTFQYFHEEYENFEDIEVVNATDFIGIEQYSFVHQNPKFGENYYQVKIEFEDGSVDYSNFKLVVFEPDAAEITIAPNPAQNELRIDLANYMDEPIYYFVSSITGQVITHGNYDQNHSKSEAINLTDFPNGTYMIYLRPSQGRETTKKFVVLKNR